MKLCHVVTAKGKYVRGLSPTSSLFYNLHVCVCLFVQETLFVCTHVLAFDHMCVSSCVIYLISISEQMLMSTPTKLTHSCTTLSSAVFRAPADTSCWKQTFKIKKNDTKIPQMNFMKINHPIKIEV